MDGLREKRLFETIDALGANGNDEALADVLIEVTGTLVERNRAVLDPGLASDARRVVLRWLRGRGFIPSRED